MQATCRSDRKRDPSFTPNTQIENEGRESGEIKESTH